MKIESKRVSFNGKGCSYLEMNPHTPGVPTILLPGWPMGPEMWRRVMPWLKRRVIAPAYPGWSQSEIGNEKLSYTSLAKKAAGLLDELEVDQAHWVGTSFGAAVALNAAYLYPEKVESVVANAPPIVYEPYLDSRQRQLAWLAKCIPGIKEIVHGQMVAGNPKVWEILIGAKPDNSNPYKRRVFEEIKTASLEGLWQSLQQIMKTDLREILPQIAAPTLILVSSGDYMYKDSLTAASSIPGAKLEEIKGGAHALPETHARQFADAVNSFTN